MPNTEESILGMGGVPQITMEVEVSGMTQTAVDKSLSVPDMAADAKATGDAITAAMGEIADLAADLSHATADIVGKAYPVGSIYMTTASTLPASIAATGTWVEIAITATWAQLKTGKRGYAELEDGDVGDAVHFWLRMPDEEG